MTAGFAYGFVQMAVMVTANQDLVSMSETSEPVYLFLNCCRCSAICEVACVYEQIAFRDRIHEAIVSIREADNSDRPFVLRRPHRISSQPGDKEVDKECYSLKRRV